MIRDLRETCPSCGSAQVASIFYGLPTDMEALKPFLESGSIILGGCDIFPQSAAFHCRLCHHEWGVTPEAIAAEQRHLQALDDRQVAIVLADGRGTLIAQTNKNGYCRCPHCGRVFSTRYDTSWDGVRHTSCLGRVELLAYQPPFTTDSA